MRTLLCVAFISSILLVSSSPAGAVTTRSFTLASYKDFEEGESTGVFLSSLGEARGGLATTRVEVAESVVYSSATAPDGTIYFGTGDQGNIYSYQKGKLKKQGKVDAVLVTALVLGNDGTIYAGGMPGGRVFAMNTDGKSKELAKLDAEHVWALAYDGAKKTLYAGTGPNGKIFAIDLTKTNSSRVLYDTGEKHVLSLIRGEDGSLYAGSADQAILYRITPEGNGAKVRAIQDFEGDEIRAIASRGSTLYVAVNEFQKSGGITLPTASTTSRGTKMTLPTPSASGSGSSTLPARDRKGKGAIYRVDPDGRVEQLLALADGYFTALYSETDGSVYAAAGANGRVYLIKPDRTVITAIDEPERQILTLAMSGPHRAIGTGDAGAVYEIGGDSPKNANYVSKVLDAQFQARFGHVRWTGQGGLTIETRSGNTSRPDKTWSSWQAPAKSEKISEGGEGKVSSPDARYLQLRVGFAGQKSLLRHIKIYYQPQNQRPRVTEIAIGDEAAAKHGASARAGKPRSPLLKLHWKTENTDEDELVYRLFFHEENETNWKPLGGPEPLKSAEYEWNTESIPDGNYVLKVTVSDERSNPKEEALEHSLISNSFLVDNRKPEVEGLKVSFPSATGRALDSFSAISELAYSIDGGDWQPFAPRDGIFDEATEDFSFKLPVNLSPGLHSLAVRAMDSADNVGAAQLNFKVVPLLGRR